ncbi:hypothetical protein CBR_g17750 [Chara braunii]|uniref:Uncharacterized protein n=1 Tax=Chara braunii TaxID=69332 RepID=A0A388KVD5_CHABU|nr:hypothetical protein CBR_g17750 [Chara braunii]|eukprot:GBG74040.1 hypothetical protein CBR_g17750 [Chara braunii]
MRIAYTQARQDRTRKKRLQEKGVVDWKEIDELQEREAEDEEEEDVPLKRQRNKARVVPKSSSRASDQAEEGEKEEGEAATRRRRSLAGASVAQRERKIEEKRPIEVGRKRVVERRTEKEGGARKKKETGGGEKIQERDMVPRVVRTKGPIRDREVVEGEKGEEEVRLKGGKGVEVGTKKRKVERGEPSQLRKEVEEEQKSKDERAQREKKRKGWRNYIIRMLQDDDLPVNSTWDVKLKRMLFSELVNSSKHLRNLQKMMGLHDMLDKKCTRLFEEYAEIARKMEKMEGENGMKGFREDVDAIGKGLQAELKGSIKLFTQGFFYYIPRLLKEMSRLRKKEEERDAQVVKLIEDVEGMKKEVEELKKGKEELKKQVSTLKASLTIKGKELEDEAAARGRVEKKVEGLCSEVSVQG